MGLPSWREITWRRHLNEERIESQSIEKGIGKCFAEDVEPGKMVAVHQSILTKNYNVRYKLHRFCIYSLLKSNGGANEFNLMQRYLIANAWISCL